MSTELLFPLLYIAGGFALLYYGGDWLVLGAVRLAARWSVSPVVIALTVVAFGTSLPELLVSFLSALTGHPAVAIGNILGSNICNICLVAGLCAVIANPMEGDSVVARRDMFVLIVSTIAFGVLGRDLAFSIFDGAVFCTIFFVYLYYVIMSDAHDVIPVTSGPDSDSNSGAAASASDEHFKNSIGNEECEGRGRSVLEIDVLEEFKDEAPGCVRFIIAGLITLPLGAHFLVKGGIEGARILGISERFISMTVVSWGTSLPELATSVTAAMRGHSAMCIGNIVGSNIFNTLMIAGTTSLFLTVNVPAVAYRIDFVLACVATIVFAVLLRRGKSVSRIEGFILLSGFFTMLYLLRF